MEMVISFLPGCNHQLVVVENKVKQEGGDKP